MPWEGPLWRSTASKLRSEDWCSWARLRSIPLVVYAKLDPSRWTRYSYACALVERVRRAVREHELTDIAIVTVRPLNAACEQTRR
jgi:hypothetical protein